jgi:crossover junction endodeoxyribonuclease RusA
MSRSWTIRLPWTAPPASANDRDHWRVKAKKVADIRFEARYAVVTQAPDLGKILTPHIRVGLVYVPRDARRRDPDNLVVPLFKALVDGLVDVGIVPDDTPEYVTREFPVILPPDGDPRLELVITEVRP